jgi:hypothetical protein
MGAVKVKGATCGFCKKWYEPYHVKVAFRVEGKDLLACADCAETKRNELSVRLALENKEIKTLVPDEKDVKTLIVLTDPSDYVDKSKFVDPTKTLITPKTNPELFETSKQVAKIKKQFKTPGSLSMPQAGGLISPGGK